MSPIKGRLCREKGRCKINGAHPAGKVEFISDEKFNAKKKTNAEGSELGTRY
jgi:hypothetical protein